MISRWGFTLRKADRLVRRFAEVPKNNINFGSFVHEYVEAPTSAHIKEEFAKHYTKATDGEMWKGSASLEGTDMYAARNPDSMVAISHSFASLLQKELHKRSNALEFVFWNIHQRNRDGGLLQAL